VCLGINAVGDKDYFSFRPRHFINLSGLFLLVCLVNFVPSGFHCTSGCGAQNWVLDRRWQLYWGFV
jgi:hypothetical protein